MFEAPYSPYLVPFDGSFRIADATTRPPEDTPERKKLRRELATTVRQLGELQRKLYAHNRHAVLAVFQAMDAGGKDSTIRAVMTGVNPAGCQVFAFKRPNELELDHDFLWRSACRLPERGRIGVFNRSYYEEVLVVRVHPELLDHQRLPSPLRSERLWEERFESIRDHEKHLARSGTTVLKFWLNVSRQEQRRRFLARLRKPEKHWKFSLADVSERGHWDDYMQAYEAALNATSRAWAPWYAIPADDKPYMRLTVARLMVEAIQRLGPDYPTSGPERSARLAQMHAQLESDP